jgi:hypothetical protein
MSTAFVPGCRHDVFVSYAHVDDVVPVGAPQGWVTTFVSELRRLLAGQLGRLDNHSVWMDHRLQGNDAVTPTILTEADNSATLLVILSQGYLRSKWCCHELDTFLNRVKTLRQRGTRVFVIEKQRLDRDRWPSELKDLRGYAFWEWHGPPAPETPTYTLGDPELRPPDKHTYYLRLNDLSFELASELCQLQSAKEDCISAKEDRIKVFLAEVTDDLEEKRQEVKRYLDQHGLQVLPDNYYPNDPEAFRRAQENDLAGCKLFAQLLSPIVGQRPPGAENGFPALQYRIAGEIAQEKELPIIQWRSPDLDLDADSTIIPAQRALLEAETVMAVPIEEFKAEVVKRAKAPPPPPAPLSKELFVFINHSDEDAELANWCREVIDRGPDSWGYTLPLQELPPRKLRQQLENNLLTSDVILWFYGHAPRAWVHEQLQNFRKLASGRKRRPLGLAICRCPPPDNPELAVKLPHMRVFDWRSALSESELRGFLENLETTGHP